VITAEICEPGVDLKMNAYLQNQTKAAYNSKEIQLTNINQFHR